MAWVARKGRFLSSVLLHVVSSIALLSLLGIQCTLWMVECLTRAGVYERPDLLERAVNMVSANGKDTMAAVDLLLFS